MCVAKKEYTQIAHSRQFLDPECSTWIKFDMTRPSTTHHAKRDLGMLPSLQGVVNAGTLQCTLAQQHDRQHRTNDSKTCVAHQKPILICQC